MSALRPLFAVAGVLLLIALVMLGIRSGDDTAVPTAGGPVSPGETAGELTTFPDDPTTDPSPTADTSPTDEPTGALSPAEPAVSPTHDATDVDNGTSTGPGSDDATDDTTEDGTTGSDTGSTGSDTGSTGSDPGSDSTTSGTDPDASGSEPSPSDGGTGSVDDMPDTGAGAVSVLGGLVALGAATGLARRR